MERCVIVIDNGGGVLKVGIAGEPEPRLISPNLSFKAKGETRYTTGDALLHRDDILSLTVRRPFEKGFLVNMDLQREIWTKIFKTHLKIQPSRCGLVVTEPLFNFDSSQAEMIKMVFDGFGFVSIVVKSSAELALLQVQSLDPNLLSNRARTGVVVDAGFSFCHVVPICNGEVLTSAVRRVDFGGKAMTNYFKELISFRSLHLMEETYLAEMIKNALCFVSQDVRKDLTASKKKAWASPFYKEFVLPDGVTNLRGYVRHAAKTDDDVQLDLKSKEQVLAVNTERFMVPEVLFNPTDIGLSEAGLPEVVVNAVEAAPSFLRPLLYSNIVLTGGMMQCPGFAERLRTELRPLVDDVLSVKVVEVDDPVSIAWRGGSLLGSSPVYTAQCLTQRDYQYRHIHKHNIK